MAKHDTSLVVVTSVTVDIDPETDKLVTVQNHELNLQSPKEVELLLERIGGGDTRVQACRVFAISVTKDGKPSIGAEVE